MTEVIFDGGICDVDESKRVLINPLQLPALIKAIFVESPEIVEVVISRCELPDRVQIITFDAMSAAL